MTGGTVYKKVFGVDENRYLVSHGKGVHAFLLHHESAFTMMDVNKGFRSVDFGQFHRARYGEVSVRLVGESQVVGPEGKSV